MIRRRRQAVLATALAAVACVAGHHLAPRPSRLERLHDAVSLRQADPARAAELLARAGPGSTLERYRLELWLQCLRSASLPSAAWRRLTGEKLPPDLERAALLGLGRALAGEGDAASAVGALERAAELGSRDADDELLAVATGETRERAVRRLAVVDPRRLQRVDRAAERSVVSHLSVEERLQRARSLRTSGAPRTAARELARVRWRGRAERDRRLEIARCWLEADNPGQALRWLRPLPRADIEAVLLRAEAYRGRAWDRAPGRSSRRDFRRALGDAESALGRAAPGWRRQQEALALVVEAGTETGDLARAWSAWRRLAALGWNGRRRGWLGRRLGVALAQRGGNRQRVLELAAELPDDARCLAYWLAEHEPRDRAALQRLAHAPFPDLYAVWAQSELGIAPPAGVNTEPPAGVGEAPPPVRLLLAWGDVAGARREWRRWRRVRGTTPGEALAAAALEASGPRPTEAIRWLNAGFPCLGGTGMDRCPADGVQAYLPLRWPDALTSAAREFGLDPWLLAALARQESTFVAEARSPAGAIGVVQLLPATARRHARALGLGRHPDLHDPEVNLRLGARELARLISEFGALEPALAAYNGGETRVRRWWHEWPDAHRFTAAVPVPETYTYVRRVVFLADAYRLVYADTWRQP